MFDDTRRATVRVYREMKGRGLPDPHAFETATVLFRHRMPHMSRDDAQFMVADWICEALEQ